MKRWSCFARADTVSQRRRSPCVQANFGFPFTAKATLKLPLKVCGFGLVLLDVVFVTGDSGSSSSTGHSSGLKDLSEEMNIADTCETCLAKGGGWCMTEQRCGEDDPQYCDVDSLIGLAGFTNDCRADEEGRKPQGRHWIDKGVLVAYTYENGTCCMGTGIVSRAYHVLEEYTVFLPNSSKEEVKTERWNRRKPAKKKDENSEYHDMEFMYFKPQELTVISGIRPNDIVQAHFAVKAKSSNDELIKSRRTEQAVVMNTTVDHIAVNFTSDYVVSLLPRDFVVDLTNLSRPAERATHEEL